MHFVLVEDEKLLRQLLRSHLQSSFPACVISEFSTLGELETQRDFLAKTSLIVLDLELADGLALDWGISFMETQPQAHVVFLSNHTESYLITKALASGLSGFVHKTDGVEHLRIAIESVLAGGVYFSPQIQKLRRQIQGAPDHFAKILSAREIHVIKLLGQGLSNEEAASMLGLKASGVAEHRKNIMQKLDLHSQGELMRYTLQEGFISL